MDRRTNGYGNNGVVPKAGSFIDDTRPVDGIDQRRRSFSDVLDLRRETRDPNDKLNVGQRLRAGVDDRHGGNNAASCSDGCPRGDANIESEALGARWRTREPGCEHQQRRQQRAHDQARSVGLGSWDQHQTISLCQRA